MKVSTDFESAAFLPSKYFDNFENFQKSLKLAIKFNLMASGLEIVVGTYEEFLLGYRVRPSRSVGASTTTLKDLFTRN